MKAPKGARTTIGFWLRCVPSAVSPRGPHCSFVYPLSFLSARISRDFAGSLAPAPQTESVTVSLASRADRCSQHPSWYLLLGKPHFFFFLSPMFLSGTDSGYDGERGRLYQRWLWSALGLHCQTSPRPHGGSRAQESCAGAQRVPGREGPERPPGWAGRFSPGFSAVSD